MKNPHIGKTLSNGSTVVAYNDTSKQFTLQCKYGHKIFRVGLPFILADKGKPCKVCSHVLPLMKCDICGAVFQPKKNTDRYCGPACRCHAKNASTSQRAKAVAANGKPRRFAQRFRFTLQSITEVMGTLTPDERLWVNKQVKRFVDANFLSGVPIVTDEVVMVTKEAIELMDAFGIEQLQADAQAKHPMLYPAMSYQAVYDAGPDNKI